MRVVLTGNGDRDDRLTAVSTPAATSVELPDADGQPGPGGIVVPAGGDVDATTGPVRIRLTSLTSAHPAEGTVPVTSRFATAGQVQVDVPTGTAR